MNKALNRLDEILTHRLGKLQSTITIYAFLAFFFVTNLQILRLEWLFRFGDRGANLKLVELLNSGLLPGIDFGYCYGLIPLSIGYVWHNLFGLTPLAYLASTVCFSLPFLFLLTRTVAMLRPTVLTLLVFLVFSVNVVFADGGNLVHTIEPLAISSALYFHLRGKLKWALVASVLGLFCKAGISHFYCLFLFFHILWKSYSQHPKTWWKVAGQTCFPASLTAIALILLFSLTYGSQAVLNSIFPIGTLNSNQNYGIFNAKSFTGRTEYNFFWYLGSMFLSWVLLSIISLVGVFHHWIRKYDTRFVLSTWVGCHFAFVFLFYAHDNSWAQHFYLLLLAASLSVLHFPRPARISIVILIPIFFLSNHSHWLRTKNSFQKAAHPTYPYLTVDPAFTKDDTNLQLVTKGYTCLRATLSGAAELMYKNYRPVQAASLYDGMNTQRELRWYRTAIAQTDCVIVNGYTDSLFRDELASFSVAYRGEIIRVYLRKQEL